MITKSGFSRCGLWKIGRCIATVEALIVGALWVGISERSLAQIVPDNTLGREGSTVVPNVTIQGIQSGSSAPQSVRIEGGAIRGPNLFHSFEQFNVDQGRGVYFTNPTGINNILTRVTGANRSDILGRLGVLGNANLFLINPQGIVFGPAASLDVQGSFLATTANAIRLGETGLFSASQPATSNLLSVSPSALWFNAVAAQPIVNRSQAQSLIGQPNSADLDPGLQVQPNRTLALIGGDILLEGGRLTTAGGRIELGSVVGAGNVNLTESGNGFRLGYDSIQNFGTLQSSSPFGVIALSNKAIVDASGAGGGDVQIRGRRLEMTENSNLRADTLGSENGGTLFIRAAEVNLSGGSLLTADVSSTGTGTGGNLTINTERLIVRNGSQVSDSTFGQGKGGNFQVTASDAIELMGTSADGRAISGLFAESNESGNAGDLRIDTGRLRVQGGAGVSVNTFGQGKGGNLQITAPDSIEIIGRSANGRRPSGLSAQSLGSGDAGNLTLITKRLLVQGGASVLASTFDAGKGGNLQVNAADSVEVVGQSADGRRASSLSAQSNFGSGDAGDLTINTRRLLVSDGAQVTVGTVGDGKGGRLQINATDSIDLIGGSPDGRFPSGLFTQSLGSKNAGELRIDTGRLRVQGGAVISSRSEGTGNAGNINVTVRNLLQANNGTIATDSAQTQGGAIIIQAGTIRLFDQSSIRSNVASGADNGGNITLTAKSILAFNDSDILAFARNGRGGNITLNTPAFFGENYRPDPSGTDPNALDNNNRVDINASGAISGIITIPDVTFIQNSLTELPATQINTDSLLANSCIVRRNQPTRGSFIVTGTGGLPQSPGNTQASSFPTVDVETLPSDRTGSTPNLNRAWQKGDPIVEPQGVYRLPNGKLVLSRHCD